MAVVNINRKTFEQEIGPLDAKMQEKIFMFGNPIQILNEKELQIEVFPNRPDMLSYQGFKRAFLAFLGKEVGLKDYKINKPEKNFIVSVDSSVKDIRPYTACAIVKDIKLDDEKIKELIEIQEKLHVTLGRKRKKLAIGIYPLEKIKLPITFKAVEPDQIKFIPLESDKELSGLEILQKHPTGKEYAHLLAGKAKFPIFVDDDNNILSMPPIINSQKTGRITSETKNLFVECSGFDEEILKSCLNILVSTMADMEAKIYQMEIKYKITKKETTPDFKTSEMKISIENVNKLLGLALNEKQIKENLEKMGHNYNKGIVTVPAWRIDILHEVDLIEDIAIAYGYENFIPEIPEISTIGEESKNEIIKRKLSEILIGLDMIEVSNYHLTTKKDQSEKMNLPEKKSNFIEIIGSKTEYNILRENLSHYLLKNLSENVDSEYPQKIFEIGKVFTIEGSEQKVNEKECLSIAVSPGNFTEIKQILDYLFKMISQKIEFKEATKLPAHFVEGRTAEVIVNKKVVGYIGEIHPKILSNWRIRMPVALLEINIDELLKN
jgi:phenylalanyl-tRNA synthetase beta chain